jgi:hypothetical protein
MIAIGLGLTGLAIWLIVSAIPAHRPLSGGEQLAFCAQQGIINCAAWASSHWMFKPPQYVIAYVGAGLLGLAGLEQMIRGATYRALREVTCRTCNTKVIGKKTFMGIRCPQGHFAEQHVGKLVLLIALIVIIILVAAGR